MLKGKTVLLGVTGGIACYKSAGLASALVKQGANVQVLMTRNATEFIGPHTFESLTGNRVSVDTFDRNYQFQVEHIALADRTDLVGEVAVKGVHHGPVPGELFKSEGGDELGGVPGHHHLH